MTFRNEPEGSSPILPTGIRDTIPGYTNVFYLVKIWQRQDIGLGFTEKWTLEVLFGVGIFLHDAESVPFGILTIGQPTNTRHCGFRPDDLPAIGLNLSNSFVD